MAIKEPISRRQYFILALSGFIIFFGIWSLMTYTSFIKPFFLPTPTATLRALITLFSKGSLLEHIGASLFRVMLGFMLASVVAIPMGILIGSFKKVQGLLGSIIDFIRYMPPSAFIPLAVLWFGIGNTEKIFIIFIGIAPYLSLLVADVVSNSKQEYLDAAYTLGAKTKTALNRVIIPQSLPGIWDSMRIMIGAAWTFVIIAEIVGASTGLGYLIIQAQRFLKTPNIIAGIIVIGVLGLATDLFFRLTYKLFFPWSEKT